ncbi:MAG: hypothetical protein M1829_003151 [Trizodia sp. TS-e1964]|nr:MAG: hypothetical protein M1829_003151 [Trizodia sp. TS-e1964]
MEPPLTLLLLLLFFSLSTASPITPAQRAQTTLPKPQRILCDACFLYMRRMGSTPSTPAICVAADGTYATSSAKCKLVRVEVYSKGLSISGISQRPNVRERVYFYLDEGGRVVAREQLMPVFIQQWVSGSLVSFCAGRVLIVGCRGSVMMW